MKKIFTLFFALMFISLASMANSVYVYGYVKNASGTAIPNQAVTISNDSIAGGNTCGVLYHVKYTNANGFYSDTLTCSGNISQVRVYTSNCNGSLVTNTIAVPQAGGNFQSDFTVGCNPQVSCAANFNVNVTGLSAQFVNTSTASSTITNTVWNFGDGTSSTLANPAHTYAAPGTYNVLLKILTNNCSDSVVKAVVVNIVPACNANFDFLKDSVNGKLFYFFAGINTAYPNNDPIIERKWKFGDGDTLIGNVQNPYHVYAQAGTYTVCLRVKTQGGCVSDLCKVITVINPVTPTNCFANYTFTPQGTLVKFNSNSSYGANGDSIISRRWNFGDSTPILTGNSKDPQHQYAQQGIYNVCLTIKTVSGCEKTICKLVTTTSSTTNCIPQFVANRIAAKKVDFNSAMSWAPANDTIIERKWNFGDGTGISVGNLVAVQHIYNNNGVYTACLKIKTAAGCVNEICKPVFVQDSTGNPSGINEPVRIVNLFPNPAHVTLLANIWSANSNIAAEIAIYDIYGVKKWSTNTSLSQGNNIKSINVGNLLNGPYVLKVKTVYGTKSRQFFKI